MGGKVKNYLLRKVLKATIRKYKKNTLNIEKQRENSDKFSRFFKIPKNIEILRGRINEIECEWIIGKNVIEDKIIIYLHGGAYCVHALNTHRILVSNIVRETNIKVILPNYRLSPENKFPAALEDIVSIYTYLLGQGYSSNNIIIIGDSAGGGLSLSTVLFLKDNNKPLPNSVICISPWTDLSNSSKSQELMAEIDPVLERKLLKEYTAMYIGEENDVNDPYISPINGNYNGFPSTLIQVGSEEILLDDSLILVEKAKAMGAEFTLEVWDGMWHVWHLAGYNLSESKNAIKNIAKYIEKRYVKCKIVSGINT